MTIFAFWLGLILAGSANILIVAVPSGTKVQGTGVVMPACTVTTINVKSLCSRPAGIRPCVSPDSVRNVLVYQIESSLYERQGRARVNFDRTLPAPQSELAKQILKDPYNVDFLTLDK
jgi:hypothetical protein